MERDHFATALRQSRELTDTMQAWCDSLNRTEADLEMHTHVLMAMAAVLTAQAHIAGIGIRLRQWELTGR